MAVMKKFFNPKDYEMTVEIVTNSEESEVGINTFDGQESWVWLDIETAEQVRDEMTRIINELKELKK